MSAWWGTRSNVSPRLRLEVEAMRAAFQDTFRLTVPNMNGLLYWTGTVHLNMSTVEQSEHTLKVVSPAEYPNRPAEAYVLRPHVYSEKHQYEDGQLCLFNPKDGSTYGWNPSRSTAVTVTGWAVQWLYAYYTWRHTGDWPGIEENITAKGRRRR
jgi:ubiquitin-protein ligase